MYCTRLASLTLAAFTVFAPACSNPSMPTDTGAEADNTHADTRDDSPSDIGSADRVTVDATVDAMVDTAVADVPVPDSASDAAADVGFTDTIDVAVATDVPLVDAGPWTLIPDAGCGARERAAPVQAAAHIEFDAALDWITNPPSSGPHYGIWARWGAWPDLPRGYWVHNLEHGGVTFLYQCATGVCAPVRDALVSVMNSIPMDPTCMPDDASPARVRVIITNDNAIETPVAAAAWGWLYAADCVDAPSLRRFYADHAGHAPEDFCFEGYYP